MQMIKTMLWTCAVGCFLTTAPVAQSQTFSLNSPEVAGSTISTDIGDDTNSALATDGAGTVVAIWLQESGIGISRSTDAGVTWIPMFDLVQASGTFLEADIAYAGNGAFVAMWLQSPSNGVVQVKAMNSIDYGQTWSEPETVPCSSPLNRIDMASNGAGTIIASLSGLRLTSFDYGVSWTETKPVTNSMLVRFERQHAPIIFTGTQFIHVYTRSEQTPGCVNPGAIDCYFYFKVAARSPDGVFWTHHRIRPTPSGSQIGQIVDLASSGNNLAILAKRATGLSKYELEVSTSQDSGVSWSAPVFVGGITTADGEATIAGNGEGWLLAQDATNSDIQIFTSIGNTESFSLLKQLGEFTDPHRLPAALAMGSNYLLTYDRLQAPASESQTPDWDIWSAFVSGNAFTAGPIVSELAPPQEPMEPMLDTKVSIHLKFNKDGKDSIKLIGEVPVSADFDPLGAPILVNIGGVERAFIMDGKGKASVGNDKLKLKVKSKKGGVEEQYAKLKVNLKKGSFKADLVDEGLTNGDVQDNVEVNVSVQYDETTAATDATLLYKAKADKKGAAK